MYKNDITLPSYAKTALSAWLFRGITIGCKLLLIPILIRSLRKEEYAVLAILSSLEGWFLLLDFGIGSSLQNYLSESRAQETTDRPFLQTAFILGISSLLLSSIFFYGIHRPISEFLFKDILPSKESSSIFLMGGLLLIMGTFGSIGYKVLMTRQKGFVVYLLQSLGSFFSLSFLFAWTFYTTLSLTAATFFIFGIPSLISFITALKIFYKTEWGAPLHLNMLFRAKNFFLFSLMAALVTLSDAIIIPKTLSVENIIEYNLLCKIFGVASFAYSAFLQGLWPECTEHLAAFKFTEVQANIRKCCTFSILGICLFTIGVFIFSSLIEKTLLISLKTPCILLFGFYVCIRVISDFYAMALQSHSRLLSFFYLVPIQALLSIFFQYTLSKSFGTIGILIGLSLSYLLTVFWVLPRQFSSILKNGI